MKMQRGIGEDHIKKYMKAETKILNVLMDAKPHRYKEIVEKTGLSSATVSKHLKKLEKRGWVKKEIDLKSKIYPYPVLYTLNPLKIGFLDRKTIIKNYIDRIEDSELLSIIHTFLFTLDMEYKHSQVKKIKELGEAETLYQILQRAVKKFMDVTYYIHKIDKLKKEIEKIHQT